MQKYSSTIKDHYHHPLNAGRLSHFNFSAEQINPLCGDETKIYVKLSGVAKDSGRRNLPQSDLIIENISHETRGCMIAVAAASVVSEYARGKTLFEIKKLDVNQIVELLNVSISPARESCADLILKAISSLSL